MEHTSSKKLRSNSIRSQLIVAFCSLISIIVGLEVLAYSWIDELPAIHGLKDNFAQLQKEQLALKGATIEFVLKDRSNDAFFSSGESIHLEAYGHSYKQFQRHLADIQMSVQALGLQDEGELEALKKALPEFEQLFKQLVETTKERGYREWGIIGEFDKAMNDLTRYDFGADNAGLLNLKLFVNEYLLAGGKSEADLSNKIYSFSMVLEKHIADDEVDKVIEHLTTYESVFKRLVAVDTKLGIYATEGLQHQLFAALQEMDQAVQLKKLNAKINEAYSNILFKVYFSLFLVAGASIIAAVLITLRLFKNIVSPIQKVKEVLSKMGKGEIPERVAGSSVDEVNQMSLAVNNLITGIKQYQEFANNIGKGNLEGSFRLLSEEDVLGKALLDMRGNLIRIEEQNMERNWITQGIAQFADILRNTNDLKILGDQLVSQLAKYMNVNQVGLYLLNYENPGDRYLSLLSCYAYDRKKFLEQRIEIGEGLLGQAILEKESLYLTDVPEDYLKITSGLGQATPSSVFILPLKHNDIVMGALEIAGFNPVEAFQKEFLEKISESIASTFSSVRINEKNKQLLTEAEEKAEQLRQQEEEVRQHMEELQATQEQIRRSHSY